MVGGQRRTHRSHRRLGLVPVPSSKQSKFRNCTSCNGCRDHNSSKSFLVGGWNWKRFTFQAYSILFLKATWDHQNQKHDVQSSTLSFTVRLHTSSGIGWNQQVLPLRTIRSGLVNWSKKTHVVKRGSPFCALFRYLELWGAGSFVSGQDLFCRRTAGRHAVTVWGV